MEVSGGFDLKPEAAVALLESVDLGESLATLGVDSVSAAPLADRLSQDVLGGQEEVPLDVLLADGSLSDLCEYLAERQQLLRAAAKLRCAARSGFTFQRCCKEEAEGCWDSSFTFERCCSLTQKRVADLEFRPSTASHYDLTHLHRDNQPRLGPVQDDEALLLYGIVRTVRPRTIVEFGTSHGFSALNWLHAIADDPDARVYSYDILPYPAAQALEADFEAADVENRLVELAFFDAGHLVEPLGCGAGDGWGLGGLRLLPSLTMNAIIAVHDTGLHVRASGESNGPLPLIIVV
ncbi:unnamed protein product [Cladocopium goreaui]|uniref:Carrier domain-containing protein n=1 Tax=Cladocopium goreaui TaxID=2562237 RepID=A0A9P1FHN4_9DINO|nr:unnamed protein product [Cladocopium goreaui]